MIARVLLAALVLFAGSAHAQTCTTTISVGANVATTVSGASAGSTVCLNSGSYGSVTFSAITKSPRVTVRSTTGTGASVELTFSNGTDGITVDSVTVTGADFSGSTTKNITIQNSTFTGHAVFNYLENSNVLFTNNTHNNIEGGYDVAPARIHLSYSATTHSGVTIQNSVMDGGSSDGVQAGTGVNIINNVFSNIREGACGECHTDAIQLLGAPDSIVRGNYIYDCSTGIVAFDGIVRATIENNIVDTRGRPWAIELYSDDSSIVRHNTLLYREGCDYGQTCGVLSLDKKEADPAGTGTVLVDNIATSISVNNGSTYATRATNLLRSGATGTDISGAPTYVGGSLPTTRAGFVLASGSLGKGDATSPVGSDIGALSGTTLPGPGNPRWRPAWNEWLDFYKFAWGPL